MGYKLVIITNQSAVARGIVTEEVLADIHEKLNNLLSKEGAPVDRIYYCPYHPDGVIEKYRKTSDWRKPEPGMLLAAAKELDLDLANSWCIGNSQSDVEAGANAQCRTILIDCMSPVGNYEPGDIKPDYIAVNMREAMNIIKKHNRMPVAKPSKTNVSPQANPLMESKPLIASETPDKSAGKGKRLKKVKKRNAELTKPSQPQEQDNPAGTEQLLRTIHEQLKSMQRNEMFDEFSLVRLIAGITQVAVFFCLLIALWNLLNPERSYDPILTALGFATVLQLMSLTLSLHGRK